MKITLQVIIEDNTAPQATAARVISLERNVEDLRPETLGLKLDEAKEVLAEIQTMMVTAQAARFLELPWPNSCPSERHRSLSICRPSGPLS